MGADSTVIPGSDALLLYVRSCFTRRGTSLTAWCRAQGVAQAYAHRALRGLTNGPAAATLRRRLIEASEAEAA
jgi:hypothetical protein